MLEIGGSQQQLGGVVSVRAERFVVNMNQMGLSRRGGRLKMGKILGAFFQTEQSHPRADRTAGYENQLATGLTNLVNLFGERRDPVSIKSIIIGGENVGTHFNDHGLQVVQNLTSAIERHRNRVFPGMFREVSIEFCRWSP